MGKPRLAHSRQPVPDLAAPLKNVRTVFFYESLVDGRVADRWGPTLGFASSPSWCPRHTTQRTEDYSTTGEPEQEPLPVHLMPQLLPNVLRPIQYLGSKLRTLELILTEADKLKRSPHTVVDLFTGTSVVAQAFAIRGPRVVATGNEREGGDDAHGTETAAGVLSAVGATAIARKFKIYLSEAGQPSA